MELKNKKLFVPIFVITTLIFSFLAYDPEEISIAGPYFPHNQSVENMGLQ